DIGDISPVLFAAFSCLIPAFVMGAAVGELKNKTSWLRGGLTAVAIDLVFLLGAIIFVFVFSYIFKIDLGGSEFTGMAIGIIFLFGVAGIIPLFIIGAVIGWLINRGEETCQKIN
ncbi:MAG: hypothetical protein NT076_05300, partial [Candidatus Pacearchaeota archaeon]|nr:hypothetical protein [Candidatus Pacearchaeota archaeon]